MTTYEVKDIVKHGRKVAVVKRVLSDDQGTMLLIQYLGSRATHHVSTDDEMLCNITSNEGHQVLQVAQEIHHMLDEYEHTLYGTGAQEIIELIEHLRNSVRMAM